VSTPFKPPVSAAADNDIVQALVKIRDPCKRMVRGPSPRGGAFYFSHEFYPYNKLPRIGLELLIKSPYERIS